MPSVTGDPWLLTPGPLTTSLSIKEAMLHDWGSRDKAFIDMTARVREALVALAGAEETHVCVPLQGSGTFVVEATIATLVPRDGKLLVLVNGAYGHRIVTICRYLDRECVLLETPEDTPNDIATLDDALASDDSITHVAAVHCETTSGILNPIEEVAACVQRHGRSLLIDAMSAFGALPLDARSVHFDALIASSNKCIEGVPGIGFSIIRESVLETCEGNSHSLSLDLYEQWCGLESSGQWRFTPPTHVLAAFDRALVEHAEEGGVAGRGRRYSENCRALVDGMRAMGFETLLSDNLQAPIIVTFRMPADPRFDFEEFYRRVAEKGFLLYPGKLTVAPSFRIGCIGRLGVGEVADALDAIRATMTELDITQPGSAAAE
ncbi:MAG: 2-aminoethylphosphonate--pyruvate transaminase [Alphaproteobacteria bacterium]|nr:2-aminoethylphosphonate--pyruvate transaminase [Alphaproteobacteria bacterium]